MSMDAGFVDVNMCCALNRQRSVLGKKKNCSPAENLSAGDSSVKPLFLCFPFFYSLWQAAI